jgi:hypothetical protein
MVKGPVPLLEPAGIGAGPVEMKEYGELVK